jgi:16S rRNA processing protein RimM
MPGLTLTGKPTRPPRAPKPKRDIPTLSGTRGPEANTPLDEVYLTLGVILGAHGLLGEMRLKLITDDPGQLTALKQVYLGEQNRPHKIIGVRFTNDGALITLAGVDDSDSADRMRGLPVRVAGKDARPLEPDEYYIFQVIGIEARDETGAALGTVTDLIETGANNVLVVRDTDGKESLYPSIPDVVIDFNPAAGYVVLRPMTWWETET